MHFEVYTVTFGMNAFRGWGWGGGGWEGRHTAKNISIIHTQYKEIREISDNYKEMTQRDERGIMYTEFLHVCLYCFSSFGYIILLCSSPFR